VKGALDINAEAHQKLNEAIERYGFSLEELGPALQKQELDKQAMQLYEDWMLLNAAGIDHAAIIERMGPAINEYVQRAVASGQEIPIAMKPIIDDMIAQGKLLDENGNAYGSAEEAGITYAKTMSQMFQELIDKVSDLVNAILGIPNKTVTVNVAKNDPNNLLGGGDDERERRGPGRATGAWNEFYPPRPGGHWVNISEGGTGEYLTVTKAPVGQGASGDAGYGGPQTIVIQNAIGGEKLDSVIMRRVRGGYIRVA
jgi:phenylpyruvate tautomerase PptA (4-oxalocrotonate tautomerase family)